MTNRIRIYKRTPVNTWYHTVIFAGREIEQISQQELAYTDYDVDGNVLATGTEDFNYKRKVAQLCDKFIYTWDGVKRNKGGYRWFDRVGDIIYRKCDAKLVKQYLKNKYKVPVIELR